MTATVAPKARKPIGPRIGFGGCWVGSTTFCGAALDGAGTGATTGPGGRTGAGARVGAGARAGTGGGIAGDGISMRIERRVGTGTGGGNGNGTAGAPPIDGRTTGGAWNPLPM